MSPPANSNSPRYISHALILQAPLFDINNNISNAVDVYGASSKSLPELRCSQSEMRTGYRVYKMQEVSDPRKWSVSSQES